MTTFAPGDHVRVVTARSSYRGKVGTVVLDTAQQCDGFLARGINVSFEGAHGMRTDIIFFPREIEKVDTQPNGDNR